MTESLAENLFNGAGLSAKEIPTRVLAECFQRERPSILFNPSDPESVKRAKKAARNHSVTVYTRLCQNCSFSCILRMLDDDNTLRLMTTFGHGI